MSAEYSLSAHSEFRDPPENISNESSSSDISAIQCSEVSGIHDIYTMIEFVIDDPDDIKTSLNELSAVEPSFTEDDRLSIARDLITDEEWEEAEKLLKEVQEELPKNITAHFLLGTIYSKKKQQDAKYEDAVKHFTEVLKLKDSQPEDYHRMMDKVGNYDRVHVSLNFVKRIPYYLRFDVPYHHPT